MDLPEGEALKLMAKASGKVRPVLRPGDLVEWLSPALPKQRGEILAVYQDRTFEVFQPLTEVLCRLPVVWVIRVLSDPMNTEGSARRLPGGLDDQ